MGAATADGEGEGDGLVVIVGGAEAGPRPWLP